MTIKFNLNTDMTSKEIIKELHDRTSGETKQELEEFFKPIDEVNFNIPSHNVVMQNEEYAIIAKSLQSKTPFSHFTLNYEYWIAGINDEGKYFCHPLREYIGKPNLESILEWVNRADEGFSKRLQGDVLLQFAKPEHYDEIDERNRRYQFRVGNISLDVQTYPQSQINLGNHKLSTDGTVIQNGDYFFVNGSNLVLQHPQHGMIEEKIPKDHWAILTNQRGRFRSGAFD